MTHALAALAAETGLPVCLMHAQGDPKTMQTAPRYENVLLDVYDYLSARIDFAEAQGIAAALIVIDPGIGFGKTVEHNLTLLREPQPVSRPRMSDRAGRVAQAVHRHARGMRRTPPTECPDRSP